MAAVDSLRNLIDSVSDWLSRNSIWDSVAAVGSIAGLLIVFVVAVAIPTSIGWAILGPINKAAGRLKAPTRFFLSDFLWFVVQLQMALAYCGQFVGVRQQAFFMIVLGFLVLAIGALWAGAVSFLSRADVTHPPRRAAFILVLLPATLSLMMVTTLIMLVAIVTSAGAFSFSYEYRAMVSFLWNSLGLTTASATFCVLLLPGAGYLLRRLSRWIVVGSSANGTPALATNVTPMALSGSSGPN